MADQGYTSSGSGSGRVSGGEGSDRNSIVLKVGMVGDSQIGKTSLMVKYVEGSFDEDYIQTLGVNFMEKAISIRNTEITFSIWDLGGQREFVSMLPLVSNDAVAILFMFDLTRKSTLNSIKEWYRQARGFNKTAIPVLIGTKYDQFASFPREEQEEITRQAKRFSKAMHAPLNGKPPSLVCLAAAITHNLRRLSIPTDQSKKQSHHELKQRHIPTKEAQIHNPNV
ncbi:septum-promoting GTP-binding protein 1 [Cryptococcus neoformans]|nr:septum-promoting GTP-binding protein 1 [Cryptococcus neoformans]